MVAPHDIVPVILAGGRVTGLKPLAGRNRIPPFLRLHAGGSFFQDTIKRTRLFSKPVVMCREGALAQVQMQLSEIGAQASAIISEPEQKGTAAAIALAAFHLKNQGKRMLVLPADQIIQDHVAFQREMMVCGDLADEGIVLVGSKPNYAEKGYGYIELTDELGGGTYGVKAFHEQPGRALMRKSHSSPQVVWNTGIFISRPRFYLDALQCLQPDLYRSCQRAYYAAEVHGAVIYPQEDEFSKIGYASVDQAIFERHDGFSVYVSEMPWGDAGTWKRFIRLKLLSGRQ